jgi:phosphatidylserine decarboxylase
MFSFKIFLQYIIPQHTLSRLMGYLGNCKNTWIKNTFIQWFVKHYHVDMQDALQTDPLQYSDFNSFFTRQLKADVRPISPDANAIVSPADGMISQIGNLQNGSLLQAKGFYYDVRQLLGGDAQRAQPFKNGNFATIYLAPRDYHRVHMPYSGTLQEMIYVPGKLFSVNNATADAVPNLFARNERVVSIFQTDCGPMAIILVGAMIVASIHTTWAGQIAPQKKNQIRTWNYAEQNIQLKRGEEMGHFQMGSTVIVLFADRQSHWQQNIAAGQTIRLGEMIGVASDMDKQKSCAILKTMEHNN